MVVSKYYIIAHIAAEYPLYSAIFQFDENFFFFQNIGTIIACQICYLIFMQFFC